MGESKIEDFSERITHTKGATESVFWDVEACPFPVSSNPDMIYHKIKSALSKRGRSGNMTIWAYVDEEKSSWGGEFLRNKTWKSRIFFLPGGDKLSRRYRMLNDMFLWKIDNPVDDPYSAALILVSDGFRYEKMFRKLTTLTFSHYNVFLVTATKPVLPESSDWPGLLLDQVYSFAREKERQKEERHRKKIKADGAEETPQGSVTVDQADTS